METRSISHFVMYTPWSKLCLLRLQRRVQLFYMIGLPLIENSYPTSTCLLVSRVNYPSSSYYSSKDIVRRPFIILLPNWGILLLVVSLLKCGAREETPSCRCDLTSAEYTVGLLPYLSQPPAFY